MRRNLKYIGAAFLGAASLVVSGVVAQALPVGPDPSEGPTTGGTTVTLPMPEASNVPSFTQVSAGGYHSLALDGGGNAWAWGYNRDGQLGNGSTLTSWVPVEVEMPTGVSFKQVSAGGYHSLALDGDGNAWAWGYNGYGQLGNGSFSDSWVPVEVEMPTGVSFEQVSAGQVHSLALDSDGKAWAWGYNDGQLGNGSTSHSWVPVEVEMPTGVSFKQVSAGHAQSLALDSDGNAWAWGYNGTGQLGNGSTSDSWVPVEVEMPTGVSFKQVSTGEVHSLALDSDGKAWAWGYNGSGQLGNGSTSDSWVPVEVEMPTGVSLTQVSTGARHTLALDDDGNAWAWGNNGTGQLGNDSTSNYSVPVEVEMPTGVSFEQVSAGQAHSLALDSDGNAWAWGLTDETRRTTVPVPVPPATVVVTGVLFDNVPGTGLVDNGNGTVSATTPAHAEGAVDVTVEWTVDGVAQEPIVYAAGFTYLPPAVAPAVTHPANVSVEEGSDASFTVTVTGNPAPTLQWQVSEDEGVSWTNVAEATGATLTLTDVALSASGNRYRVVATNTAGDVTSGAATLTVTPKPVVPPVIDKAERLAGPDRYGTNLALLKAEFEAGDVLFVATGTVYPDALSAGPAVAVSGGQLALTPTKALRADLKAFLEANKPSQIYIIGGEGAVSPSVEQALKKIAPVERVSGNDRYETSLEVFNRFFASPPPRAVSAGSVFVATGQDFPDALTASAAGGSLGEPVVLTQGKTGKELPAATVKALKDAGVKDIHIVGGKGAVNEATASSLTKAGFNVDRLGGADRYETNLAVNNFLGVQGVTGLWVATGKDFPDALSAAVPASEENQRLVLAKKGCIPGPVVPEWIKGEDATITNVTLVGGTGVLANTVQNLTACTG